MGQKCQKLRHCTKSGKGGNPIEDHITIDDDYVHRMIDTRTYSSEQRTTATNDNRMC